MRALVTAAAAGAVLAAAPTLMQELGASPASSLGATVSGLAWTFAAGLWAFAGARALDRLVWAPLARRPAGRPTPKLLIDLARVAIWLVAAVLAAAGGWGLDVAGVLTASSVLVVVVGFAVRGLIADAFYGIALALEDPMSIGDWLRIDDKLTGEVVDITWRATRLRTLVDTLVVVPHSHLAAQPFVNLSRPSVWSYDSVEITLDYGVTSHTAERILLSAARQAAEPGGPPAEPFVTIANFAPDGVVWRLYVAAPDPRAAMRLRTQVRRKILRNLHFAGLSVPRDKHEVFIAQLDRQRAAERGRVDSWIARVELFQPLGDVELAELSARARRRLALKGEAIVREGEAGDSLFVVLDGALDVLVATPEGPRRVGGVSPGGVFGEASLLTGAPRGATVTAAIDSTVFEIGRADLEPCVARHPEVAAQMSRILAARQLANAAKLAERPAAEIEAEHIRLADQLLGRIRGLFRLG